MPGPSLYEWASMLALMEPFDDYPVAVRSEARALTPDSYPTRALYGHYLNWVLRRLCSTAPAGVTIRLHEQSAIAVDDAAENRRDHTADRDADRRDQAGRTRRGSARARTHRHAAG
ncbi:FAD/NAD(P)-binding protein [Lentzea albidocapillata]|uniref:FAD/NAD(P)-binding protein n=1 Tax=Lentzea albidocapillata TaxID=40571 RepID=UPI00210EEE2B|nr:FAD/NAD(P)-binding protein [Lentzea albidocapillata]